ncbi:hypothetical protein ACOMHN_060043 [Nucella lapillus]
MTASPLLVTQAIITAFPLLVTQAIMTASPLLVTQTIMTASPLWVTQAIMTASPLLVTQAIMTASTLLVTQAIMTASPLLVTQAIMTASPLFVTQALMTASPLLVTQAIMTASPLKQIPFGSPLILSATCRRNYTIKPESRETTSRPRTELGASSAADSRAETDLTPFSLQPNDEYGIPLLEMSSTSEDSSDEEAPKKKRAPRVSLPSVGPPQILKLNLRHTNYPLHAVWCAVRAGVGHVGEPERGRGGGGGGAGVVGGGRRGEGEEEEEDLPVDEEGKALGMFAGPCEFCRRSILPLPSLDMQHAQDPASLYCCEDYREFVEFATSTAARMEQEAQKATKVISIKVHPHHGSKQARRAAKDRAVERMRQREQVRRQQEALGSQANFYSSRQMKTINYQLSSQRCLEEGWTLRPPSPLEVDEAEAEVFMPEPLHPAMIASGNFMGRQLIQKYYPSGAKFITMFPDGTGNVLYPSGRLAVLVSSTTVGQYSYIVQDDTPEASILATFDPTGFGCVYFLNGNVKLYYDQLGGMEVDVFGGRRRRWQWKDQEAHVHAPPLQPLCLRLNRSASVRVMSQEAMALTFMAQRRSCRFSVGARLKLVAPELLPRKEIDEHQLFIDERTAQVESILSKVSVLLKFPKSPKVDKILPPLHVTSKMSRNQKMRKELTASLQASAEGKAGNKNKAFPAVSVN